MKYDLSRYVSVRGLEHECINCFTQKLFFLTSLETEDRFYFIVPVY